MGAWRSAAALALFLVAAGAQAMAPAYPTRPIRAIVPFPAGGTTDIVARAIAPPLAEALGQPVIVENKGGAGGSIGSAEVARAASDGHTLLIVFDNHAVNHHLYRNLPYDTFKAFEPVSLIVQSPLLLVAAPDVPFASVGELIAYGKVHPGKLAYGSTGTGNSSHLATLLLAQRAGFDALHVPYKGGGPLTNDLLGGQVNFAFASLPLFAPHVSGGKLKGLGVAGRERVSQLPQVPLVADTVPGFEAQSWVGMLVPTGTPSRIIERLSKAVRAALARSDVSERMGAQGFNLVGSTPAEFGAHIRSESEKWGKVIRELNVVME